MLAGIVKGADFAVLAGDHEDALLEDVLDDETAGFAELVHVSHDMPALHEDGVLLVLEDLAVIEVGRGQRKTGGGVAVIPGQVLGLQHGILFQARCRAGCTG